MKVRAIRSNNNTDNSHINFSTLNYTFDRKMVFNDLMKKYNFEEKDARAWISFNYLVLKKEVQFMAFNSNTILDEFSLISIYEKELHFMIANKSRL